MVKIKCLIKGFEDKKGAIKENTKLLTKIVRLFKTQIGQKHILGPYKRAKSVKSFYLYTLGNSMFHTHSFYLMDTLNQ